MAATVQQIDAGLRVAQFLDAFGDHPYTDGRLVAQVIPAPGAAPMELVYDDLVALVHACGLRDRPQWPVRYQHLGPFQWGAMVGGRPYRVERRDAEAAQYNRPPYVAWDMTPLPSTGRPDPEPIGRTYTLELMRPLLRHHRDNHDTTEEPTP